jgi:ERCC4-type nuclease
MSLSKEISKTVEPAVGQVYEHTDTQYQVLYCDEQVVLLRTSDEGRSGDNTHRIERRVYFEKQVESGWFNYLPDSDLDMMSFDRKDWSEVDYIGEKTSQNLHDAGYETNLDIQQADDDELLDVDGLGKGGLRNLREFAR